MIHISILLVELNHAGGHACWLQKTSAGISTSQILKPEKCQNVGKNETYRIMYGNGTGVDASIIGTFHPCRATTTSGPGDHQGTIREHQKTTRTPGNKQETSGTAPGDCCQEHAFPPSPGVSRSTSKMVSPEVPARFRNSREHGKTSFSQVMAAPEAARRLSPQVFRQQPNYGFPLSLRDPRNTLNRFPQVRLRFRLLESKNQHLVHIELLTIDRARRTDSLHVTDISVNMRKKLCTAPWQP